MTAVQGVAAYTPGAPPPPPQARAESWGRPCTVWGRFLRRSDKPSPKVLRLSPQGSTA